MRGRFYPRPGSSGARRFALAPVSNSRAATLGSLPLPLARAASLDQPDPSGRTIELTYDQAVLQEVDLEGSCFDRGV